jgi:16S rRNA (cytidine1402-2'-O)-methyltransferase
MYEAPHRIAATLRDALEVLGNREATVSRELTKLHEDIARGRLRDLVARFGAGMPVRGEIVLIISGAAVDEATLETEPASRKLIARVKELESVGLDAKLALKKAARELGMKRDEAYRVLMTEKNRTEK